MNQSAVGQVIRKAREKKGITQTKAGKLLRMSEQFIGRIEAGEVPLPFSRAAKFLKILGIKKSNLGGAYVKDYAKKVTKALNPRPKRH